MSVSARACRIMPAVYLCMQRAPSSATLVCAFHGKPTSGAPQLPWARANGRETANLPHPRAANADMPARALTPVSQRRLECSERRAAPYVGAFHGKPTSQQAARMPWARERKRRRPPTPSVFLFFNKESRELISRDYFLQAEGIEPSGQYYNWAPLSACEADDLPMS